MVSLLNFNFLSKFWRFIVPPILKYILSALSIEQNNSLKEKKFQAGSLINRLGKLAWHPTPKRRISGKNYHVIVASATTRENALAFRRFLIKNTDFNKSKVFKAPSGYAVSIGEWNYNEAVENAKKFMEMPRFHKDYQNIAYLQIPKDEWIQISQD